VVAVSLAIADITCDVNGSIEILKQCTDFNNPFFIYEPILEKYTTNVDHATSEGILYLAIPNLAASFSLDASDYFSKRLVNYIDVLSKSKYLCSYEEQGDIPKEILGATITCNGSLTPLYKNTFKVSEENNMLHSLKEDDHGAYSISYKMRGHLFNSGFFNNLINLFRTHSIDHKINYLSIGDSLEVPSVLYFDVFANTKDVLKIFHNVVQESIDLNKLESEIIKNNVF
jgi:alpha-aminoadipic semialdehyde synthase